MSSALTDAPAGLVPTSPMARENTGRTTVTEPRERLLRSSPPGSRGTVCAVLAVDHSLVVIAGDVDLTMSAALTRIATYVVAGLPTIVDVTGVDFADGTLVNVLALLARPGRGRVTVCNPSHAVRDLIGLCDVDVDVVVAWAHLENEWT
jgi:anti-anti-sigma regulatory factor